MIRTTTIAAAALVLLLGACAEDEEDANNAADMMSPPTPTTTPEEDLGTTPPPGPASQVRVAHLSPDAPPVDFCFVPPMGDPIGPILHSAGLAQGIAFGGVTPYLPAADGLFSVRIVAGGDTTCDNGLLEFPNVAVPTGGLQITAAAVGLLAEGAEPSLNLVFFVDDTSVPAADKAKVRIIHAVPGLGAVRVGVLDEGQSTLGEDKLIAANASFATMTSPPYTELDAASSQTLRIESVDDDSMGADVAGVDLVGGVATTVFAIGASLGELQLLICDDIMGDCVVGP